MNDDVIAIPLEEAYNDSRALARIEAAERIEDVRHLPLFVNGEINPSRANALFEAFWWRLENDIFKGDARLPDVVKAFKDLRALMGGGGDDGGKNKEYYAVMKSISASLESGKWLNGNGHAKGA